MKNILLKCICLLAFSFTLNIIVSGQGVPQGSNYMAVATYNGETIHEKTFPVRITIQNSVGNPVYQETHSATTDKYGLFSIVIGNGAPLIGTFTAIDWKAQTLFIKTEIKYPDTEPDFVPMGTAQIWSVPYSQVSKDVVSPLKPLTIKGTSAQLTDPIFEVKNTAGDAVFSVYGDGIRIQVGDLDKSSKGGFSIGGFGKKADPVPYLTVTRDFTEVNANRAPTKGAKGGFSVGGFGGKTDPPSFYLNMTPKNYLIGEGSGSDINFTGEFNSIIGYQAGKSLTTGSSNTMLGHLAGTSVTTGSNNIVIGEYAGNNLEGGEHNTIIGNSAGYHHINQNYNVMIGQNAGYFVNGSYNNFIGINSGFKISSGANNVFLGTNAGAMIENGYGNTMIGIDAGRSGAWDPYTPHGYYASDNTILGNGAGYSLDSGDGNVLIGAQAGSSLLNASGNVFIGYSAGSYETGSDKLYITNKTLDEDDNPTIIPLIYGDFSTHQLGINTTTLSKTLNVGGDLDVSGTLTATGISGPVTGNVSGSLSGSVNGASNGKIYFNASDGIVASIYSGNYDIYWNHTAKTLTLRNSEGTWCHYNFQKMAFGSLNLTYESAASNLATKVLVTFADNSDACIISFGDESNTGYCTMWLQYSNSKLFGHYIKY